MILFALKVRQKAIRYFLSAGIDIFWQDNFVFLISIIFLIRY